MRMRSRGDWDVTGGWARNAEIGRSIGVGSPPLPTVGGSRASLGLPAAASDTASAVPRLTLSFDNGPFPDVTPGVLDALADAGATATFFVCGKDALDPQRRPLLEAIRDAGHR